MGLYAWHEMQKMAWAPSVRWANVQSRAWEALGNLGPMGNPMGRRAYAGLRLWDRWWREYPKPSWHIPAVEQPNGPVPVQESVVDQHPFCQLLRFTAGGTGPRVLVVAPWSGHHATLLRDTIAGLLSEHREVWVTDWSDAGEVPVSAGTFGLDDYVALVDRWTGRLLHDGPLHILAVCQPVVPVLAAVALRAQRGDTLPDSLMLMGGPIDPRQGVTRVNRYALEHPLKWFENNVIDTVPPTRPGAGRRVYPGFLQHMGFVAMNPQRHWDAYDEFYDALIQGDRDDENHHLAFYDEYNAVLDLPAEFYLDTIERVFQRYDLAEGTFEVHGVRVNPAAIRDVALLTVEGELDDIAGVGQTRAALDLCTSLPESMKAAFLAPDVGHYGVFSGRRYRESIRPRLTEWMRAAERDQGRPSSETTPIAVPSTVPPKRRATAGPSVRKGGIAPSSSPRATGPADRKSSKTGGASR